MKVQAIKSFSSVTDTGRQHYAAGAVFELPEGVDWLRAGLVKPAGEAVGSSTASMEATETAVSPAQQAQPRSRETVPVTAVSGIGAATAETLAQMGVETVPQLLAADDALLLRIDGVGPATVRRWKSAARELIS